MRTVELNGTSYRYLNDYFSKDNTALYLQIIVLDFNFDKVIQDAKNNGDFIRIYDDGQLIRQHFGYSTLGEVKIVSSDVTIEFKQTYNDKESLINLVGERISVPQSKVFRKEIETLADFADDDTASKNIWAYGPWEVGVLYKVGEKRTYEGNLYKCLQEHTSQDIWTPTAVPSLWAKVINEDPTGEIPVWEQPSSTNPYMKGDKVHYPTKEDAVYKSTIDNNIWSPRDYPQGWEVVE